MTFFPRVLFERFHFVGKRRPFLRKRGVSERVMLSRPDCEPHGLQGHLARIQDEASRDRSRLVWGGVHGGSVLSNEGGAGTSFSCRSGLSVANALVPSRR